MFHGRQVGQHKSHDQCPDGWRRAQHSQPRGADLQNIRGIDGQQGNCAAKQDREHIQRNSRQNDLRIPG